MSLKYGFSSYAIVLTMCVPSALFRAYVLATCWLWFAVPLGLPAVSKAGVYGLAMLAGLATHQSAPVKDKDIAEAGTIAREATSGEKGLWVATHVAQMFVPTAIIFAWAYAAHLIMGL